MALKIQQGFYYFLFTYLFILTIKEYDLYIPDYFINPELNTGLKYEVLTINEIVYSIIALFTWISIVYAYLCNRKCLENLFKRAKFFLQKQDAPNGSNFSQPSLLMIVAIISYYGRLFSIYYKFLPSYDDIGQQLGLPIWNAKILQIAYIWHTLFELVPSLTFIILSNILRNQFNVISEELKTCLSSSDIQKVHSIPSTDSSTSTIQTILKEYQSCRNSYEELVDVLKWPILFTYLNKMYELIGQLLVPLGNNDNDLFFYIFAEAMSGLSLFFLGWIADSVKNEVCSTLLMAS